jgi:hypothetical protein
VFQPAKLNLSQSGVTFDEDVLDEESPRVDLFLDIKLKLLSNLITVL